LFIEDARKWIMVCIERYLQAVITGLTSLEPHLTSIAAFQACYFNEIIVSHCNVVAKIVIALANASIQGCEMFVRIGCLVNDKEVIASQITKLRKGKPFFVVIEGSNVVWIWSSEGELVPQIIDLIPRACRSDGSWMGMAVYVALLFGA
jgi:hypothetical protein